MICVSVQTLQGKPLCRRTSLAVMSADGANALERSREIIAEMRPCGAAWFFLSNADSGSRVESIEFYWRYYIYVNYYMAHRELQVMYGK